MNTNRRSIQIARWLLFLLLLTAGVWSLWVAAFHFWVGMGPGSDNPEWHEPRGNWYLGQSMLLFVLAPLSAWWLRPKPV